jgi:hypothetical protein
MTESSSNGVHPPVVGFRPKPRTIEVVCDWLPPDDGAAPLTATLMVNMTNAEAEYLGELVGRINTGLELREIWPMIAHRVLAWNAEAFDMTAGAWAAVPPPAEVGADAFRAVDSILTTWLLYELANAHLGRPDRPKGQTPPASTDDGNGGDNSTSAPPTGTPSTSPRTGSRKRSRAT